MGSKHRDHDGTKMLHRIFFLWLMLSFPCQAFQCPRRSSSWRLLDATKSHDRFRNGNSIITARFHHNETVPDNDERFHGNGNQTAISNNPVDGSLASDHPPIHSSSLADVSRRFQKHCRKSCNAFVYGCRYEFTNLLSLSLWQLNIANISLNLFHLLLHWLEGSPILHDLVIRVCGSVLFHFSFVVCTVLGIAVAPIVWLYNSTLRNWQGSEMLWTVLLFPLVEEIVFRWIFHDFWQWIAFHRRRHEMVLDSRRKSEEGQSNQNFTSQLLAHKDSFRVLSSLFFGLSHIGHYHPLWKGQIHRQTEFVLKGMLHAASTFFASYFCFVPLFATNGIMASIAAHSTWNLLSIWKDGQVYPIMACLAFVWAVKTIIVGSDGIKSDVVHKLLPPYPSTVDDGTTSIAEIPPESNEGILRS